MLCPRLVPKDIPRNHPCHIDDTDDDCSQKVQCGKNNIQNIHDGIPPLGISCVYIRNRQEDDKKLNFLLTRHNVTRGREHDRCTCRQHLSSTKYHKMWQNAMLSETYIKTRSPFGIGRTRGASRCSLMVILHKRYQHVPDIIVCSSLKKSNVLFQLLFLYNVRLHLRFSPAVEVGLTLPGDAKSLRGDVLGDGAAGGGVGPVADGDGGDKVGVAADEAVVADLSAELVLAVVVAGDGAAAEITVLAYIAVADVGQVADGVAPGKVGVLRLDISAQMHTVAGDGVDAHMGEGTDVVVGAEVAAVDLAGVDGGAFVHGAVLDEGVGADDAACADGGLAAQDGACEDDGSRGNDHFGADLHIAAADVYAVCDVAQQHLFTLGLGSVELCLCGSQCGCINILHREKPPPKPTLAEAVQTPAEEEMLYPR